MNWSWNTLKQFLSRKNIWTGTQTISDLVATTADINGGTVDATTIGETTPNTGRFLLKTIEQPATDTLTAIECSGTKISNYGQSAENTQTLPTAAADLSGIVVIETEGAGAFHLKAGANDKSYLNGTAMDDGDKVSITTPTIGDFFSFWSIRTGASTYDWIISSGAGVLIDGGA